MDLAKRLELGSFELGNKTALEPFIGLDRSQSLCRADLKGLTELTIDSKAKSLLSSLFFIGKASELHGVGSAVCELTLDYIETRKQFGREVGSFQAVQHKMVDAYAALESLGALCSFAAWSLNTEWSDDQFEQSELACQSALHRALLDVPVAIEICLQLHAGIGFTWEYDLHLYLRRAKHWEMTLLPIVESYLQSSVLPGARGSSSAFRDNQKSSER